MPSNHYCRESVLTALELERRPLSRHQIASSTRLPVARVSQTLTQLKEKGTVEHEGRGRWARAEGGAR